MKNNRVELLDELFAPELVLLGGKVPPMFPEWVLLVNAIRRQQPLGPHPKCEPRDATEELEEGYPASVGQGSKSVPAECHRSTLGELSQGLKGHSQLRADG